MAIKKYSKAFFFSTMFVLAGLQLGNWVGRDSGFRVQKVTVTGCKMLSEQEVLTAAKVPLHKSMFEVEFAPIAKRVEALPYVQHVQVLRIFPSTVVISVQERKPLALINTHGLWPIDEEGVILPRLQSDRWLRDPASLDMPVLSGISFVRVGERKQLTATGKHLLEFLVDLRLANAMLYHSISEFNINSRGQLTLYLMKGGVPVYLGANNWREKCERLFILLQHVKPASGKFASIDLRYENQIVTREG
ncbi:MAG: FtsQ-type POTRA domain-containing protein [candidate division KSB1 bacterium]|nr:FtsQ-type POTRA domain-containing protein [candidate division KSB1 bacterium]MDZ7301568.1 FtsQ-type POTRA domain-containing protein [candidate division KSB1 bacterium]MDZ7311016.1 FtsQ-type POTRA domain-containing protein [candidate division KSB1 bacterium]